MSAWPRLSTPVRALDNFHIAVATSKATQGRPPARPTGGCFSITRRDALSHYDPSPLDEDERVTDYALRRGE